MPTWFPEEEYEKYLEKFLEMKVETEEYVREERGESGFDNPAFVWEVAQSAPTYSEFDDLIDYLKLSDAVYAEYRREIDWTGCSRRIEQYVTSDHKEPISVALPTDYARNASEEIILHTVTYQLTGEGHPH